MVTAMRPEEARHINSSERMHRIRACTVEQMPVTDAYRRNWDETFGRKERPATDQPPAIDRPSDKDGQHEQAAR